MIAELTMYSVANTEEILKRNAAPRYGQNPLKLVRRYNWEDFVSTYDIDYNRLKEEQVKNLSTYNSLLYIDNMLYGIARMYSFEK